MLYCFDSKLMFFSPLLSYFNTCNSVLCRDIKQAAAVKSQLQHIAHSMYSSPPIHGILLVTMILSDPDMEALWRKEIKVILLLLTFFCLFHFLF